MAKRRKFAAQENAGFGGMDLSGNPQRLAGHIAQFDKNGDHRWPMTWAPRPGLARGALAKITGIVRNLKWFTPRTGTPTIFYGINNIGTLWGIGLPAPGWNPPPVLRGGPGPEFANPVTNLQITALSGLTLTWTNPVQAFWRGTKVLRRKDCYPQGPNDPAATVVYNGRLATCTDTALVIGETGYYSAYAYTRTLWAEPAKISGTKIAARVMALTATNLYYSADDGTSWATATGLPGALHQNMCATGAKVFVIANGGTKVYKSANAGTSFTLAATIVAVGTRCIIGNSGRILVNKSTKISYSDDDGATWTDTAAISGANGVLDLAYVSGTTIVAICQANAGADPFTTHISTDNGATFGASVGGDGKSVWARIAVCSNGNFIVYADSGGAIQNFWLSVNSGANWTNKGTGTGIFSCPVFASGAGVLLGDPAGALNTYYSVNSGANWTWVATYRSAAAVYTDGAWYTAGLSAVYRGAALSTPPTAVTSVPAGTILSLAGAS